MKEGKDSQPDKVTRLVHQMMGRYHPPHMECREPTIEGTLICHLSLLKSIFARLANNAVMTTGMTFQQWLALGAISHQAETGVRHSELGDLLKLSKAPVTGMVDRLERAGWAKRVPDKQDRRATRIIITDDGLAAWRRAQKVLHKNSKELFAVLSDKEMYDLLSALGRLLDNASQREAIPELIRDKW